MVDLLAAEKGWGRWRRRQEVQRGREFLTSFRAAPGPPQVQLWLTTASFVHSLALESRLFAVGAAVEPKGAVLRAPSLVQGVPSGGPPAEHVAEAEQAPVAAGGSSGK